MHTDDRDREEGVSLFVSCTTRSITDARTKRNDFIKNCSPAGEILTLS